MRAFSNSKAIKRGGPHQDPDAIDPLKKMDNFMQLF